MKKNYLEAKENNDDDAISDFLSSMGHNVALSVMQGRTDNYEETRRNSYVSFQLWAKEGNTILMIFKLILMVSLRLRINSRKAKSNAMAAPSKRNKIVAKHGTHLNCDICNVNFSRKDNLSRHMRNKH